ncbi:hypothetical protein [Paraburkholderia sp. BCC1884]|uniref:hypothetical protein n=1 Tax=Paraburkholderia sp. BCC1884 TaxID=2562668 RepID=UPI001183AD3D|nr:hypothetical protein [Paraburkholderia sp. BCC1884]
MLDSVALDSDARAELLCYLVVAQLVAHARTGEWLRTDHLVESARIWTGANGADGAWAARAELGQISASIAPTFQNVSALCDCDSLAKLFTDGWRLDYRSALVRWLHDVCDAHLQGEAVDRPFNPNIEGGGDG